MRLLDRVRHQVPLGSRRSLFGGLAMNTTCFLSKLNSESGRTIPVTLCGRKVPPSDSGLQPAKSRKRVRFSGLNTIATQRRSRKRTSISMQNPSSWAGSTDRPVLLFRTCTKSTSRSEGNGSVRPLRTCCFFSIVKTSSLSGTRLACCTRRASGEVGGNAGEGHGAKVPGRHGGSASETGLRGIAVVVQQLSPELIHKCQQTVDHLHCRRCSRLHRLSSGVGRVRRWRIARRRRSIRSFGARSTMSGSVKLYCFVGVADVSPDPSTKRQ